MSRVKRPDFWCVTKDPVRWAYQADDYIAQCEADIAAAEARENKLHEVLRGIVHKPPLRLTANSPVEWWHRLVEDMTAQARAALPETEDTHEQSTTRP